MATTAHLLETYVVDLTRSSEEEGDDHTTQTATIISTCIEILLQADDYIEYGFPIDGDELTKMAGRRSNQLLQRKLRTHNLLWTTICITTAIWTFTLGLAL